MSNPKMVIPKIEEIEAYGKTIGLPLGQCERFMDHHEARGWMLGKVRMVSWKAALRTWKANWIAWTPTPEQTNRDILSQALK